MGKEIKRFYKEAAVLEKDGGFQVLLDGRAVKTPKGSVLLLPTPALAQAVAAEWNAQTDKVDPDRMPMMQMAATAIDRVGSERPAMHENLMRYSETDLVCYRAAHPADLVRRQQEAWQPVVDWVTLRLDAPMTVTDGLTPVAQPTQALNALAADMARLDDWRFAALAVAVAASGSLLLGLALLHGFKDADAVIAASQLDDIYQQELWGADEEAVARNRILSADIETVERFLRLL